ncbi:Aminomethyltransferase folate-binding domain-containing protein [Pholiota conissans]|uniref:Aminomethyltransferase folate-binding domain-containing protein n=1 Tax=Pholiota conissans TaxID=109636 RepID=A0A9P5ZC68_9AGAR|nr:Aminomethyltransferase folate-binding domain-containing protein [Pholiota conissans]
MFPRILGSLLRTTPTIAPVANRGVLSITGSHFSEFLNGLVATSVRGPSRNQFSTILHAQGRVMYDIFLYATSNGYLLEFDTRESKATPLLSYFKRHVLRSKVKIRDATDEFDVWAVWGSENNRNWETERQWLRAQSGAIEPDWSQCEEWPWGTQENVIQDRRAVGMGRRLLVKKGDKPQEASTHDIMPTEEYLLHRILNGVPEGTTEIQPMQAFPMNSNLDVMGGLDFRKGCYVGQELTVRTYHTGVVRKRIMPVIIHRWENEESLLHLSDGGDRLTLTQFGEDIRSESTDNDTGLNTVLRSPKVGRLLSTHESVGLALVQTESALAQKRGDCKLNLQTLNVNGAKECKLGVTPYWPDWWPFERSSKP